MRIDFVMSMGAFSSDITMQISEGEEEIANTKLSPSQSLFSTNWLDWDTLYSDFYHPSTHQIENYEVLEKIRSMPKVVLSLGHTKH